MEECKKPDFRNTFGFDLEQKIARTGKAESLFCFIKFFVRLKFNTSKLQS